jgi:glycosyltransferase involved in cell wall biosynthesis
VSRLKILLLTTFFHPDKFGGAERVVFELAKNLTLLGQEVTVLTHQAPGTAVQEEMAGFRVLRYPAVLDSRFAFYRSVYRNARSALKQLLNQEEFHVLHTHQLLSAVAALFPASLFKGNEAASFYAPYHQEFETKYLQGRPAAEAGTRLGPGPAFLSWVLKQGDRYVLKRAKAIVVLSRFSLGQVESLLGKSPDHAHIIPAGVDHDRFKPVEDRAALKEALGMKRDLPLLFTVRRLVERMGLTDLIDSAALLAERKIPFQLAVGGRGPLCTQLEAQARDSAAASHIRFLGEVTEEDLPRWYGACDLFALPTRSLEGFGMVTLEALSSGVPVLGTHVGATAEILGELDPFLLVDEPGPAAMADRMEALLADPARLDRLGREARALVEKKYGWPAVAEQTLKVYREAARPAGT